MSTATTLLVFFLMLMVAILISILAYTMADKFKRLWGSRKAKYGKRKPTIHLTTQAQRDLIYLTKEEKDALALLELAYKLQARHTSRQVEEREEN